MERQNCIQEIIICIAPPTGDLIIDENAITTERPRNTALQNCILEIIICIASPTGDLVAAENFTNEQHRDANNEDDDDIIIMIQAWSSENGSLVTYPATDT